ncbi:MAG: ACP S-malonyltransferase, partial [Firmicutes bacterium]|nr:ACP S-malonyltransferase [Bacillota bacterium]
MDKYGKTALVFPGQGAQSIGMGKALYDSSKAAKAVFELIEKSRKGTLALMFEGNREELSLTINTQPCIFAVSMAFAESLKEQGIIPKVAAGFSVGEVAALTYAGAFSLEDGLKVVTKRAELMTICAEKTKGAMSAVLRLENDKIVQMCNDTGVYAVNFNCPGQIVVSGEQDKMTEFNTAVTAAGGRAVPLAVSGAFHSPLMADAAKEFRKYLDTIKINALQIPVIANVTAKPYDSDIKDIFAIQIQSPVLWQQTVE